MEIGVCIQRRYLPEELNASFINIEIFTNLTLDYCYTPCVSDSFDYFTYIKENA